MKCGTRGVVNKGSENVGLRELAWHRLKIDVLLQVLSMSICVSLISLSCTSDDRRPSVVILSRG